MLLIYCNAVSFVPDAPKGDILFFAERLHAPSTLKPTHYIGRIHPVVKDQYAPSRFKQEMYLSVIISKPCRLRMPFQWSDIATNAISIFSLSDAEVLEYVVEGVLRCDGLSEDGIE